MGLVGSPALVVVLFRIGGFAHQMLNGALLTLCSDAFDTATVDTASGTAGHEQDQR
jgi:ACS family hexuronate transporter-like MFS transporter